MTLQALRLAGNLLGGNPGVNFQYSTKVTGGERVYSFIADVQDPALYIEMARRFVREFPIQRLRQQLPEGATGRLRRNLRLVQRGAGVVLIGVWYARFGEKNISNLFYELAIPLVRRIASEVIREAAGT